MTTLALIGQGRWGSNYLKEAKKVENCKIKYIKTHNYRELLDYPDIDGIIIATPAQTHFDIIETFPNNYLLVEKPLTTSLTDARRIKNKKIMVGHTYLFNITMINEITKLGPINHIKFTMHNTDSYGSSVGPIWELASHPVSLLLKFGGRKVQEINANLNRGNLTVGIKTDKCLLEISVGWNYSEKLRKFTFEGENGTYETDDIDINTISPLENEIRKFTNFIHRGENVSPLNDGVKVVELLSKIEKVCMIQ